MKKAPDINATLLASLKRHNPSKVRAYAADDDSRDIAVPARRRKWGAVIAAIEALSWVRVEMLDKSGAVLGYVENAEPARELEELSPSPGAVKDASELRLAERIVGLVMRGQRDALTFRDAEVTALLRAQGDVVRELAASVGALGAVYREQVAATRESGEERAAAVAAAAATAAGANQGELQQLLEAMPTLIQVLPMLRGMLSPGTTPPAARTNGVKE
jgi:hypothetical protein